jgi:hypothetical protein
VNVWGQTYVEDTAAQFLGVVLVGGEGLEVWNADPGEVLMQKEVDCRLSLVLELSGGVQLRRGRMDRVRLMEHGSVKQSTIPPHGPGPF